MSRFALAGALLLALQAWGQDDPREIVLRSVSKDQNNFARAKDYTYLERVARQDVDSKGRTEPGESHTFDVTIIEGRPYRRETEKNDKPLSVEESRKAQEKFDKTLRERQAESPAARAKREAEAEKQRREGRAFLTELPDAFDFRLLGGERVDGRDAWVIQAEPRPGYRPKVRRGDLLKKFRGTLWIDKASYDWVRVEAETIDTVSFGWLLARVAKGTRMEFRQMLINNEVWMPERVHIRLDARVALLKRVNQEVNITFRNYRKFQAESRVVPVDGSAQ